LFLSAQSDSIDTAGSLSKNEKKEKKPTIFEHFSKDPSITEVTLTTNLDSLSENKFRDFEVNSTYAYTVDGKDVIWTVKISPRGKSRKKICDIPPYYLNFSKNELKARGIKKKHDKLKMVNYCKKGKRYEYFLFREYLVYKMYNIISENSFRVKLTHVTYKDAQNDVDPFTKYSFLIEDTDEMADRVNAKEINKYDVSTDSCSSFDFDVLCMFQYMISNTDWNTSLLHNVKLIEKKKTGEVVVVPYDFDYSGLVNAEYSVPNPDYPQFGVRHRIYIGDYPTDEEMEKIIQHFKEREQEIYALINDFELLDKGWKKDMNRFLKKFFKDLKKPKKLKRKCLASQNDYRSRR
jgi:hypothetical protein